MTTTKAYHILLVTVALSLCNGLSYSATSNVKPIRFPPSCPSALLPPSPTFPSLTALHQSVTSTNGGGATTSYDKIDWAALVKYGVGVGGQMSLIFGFLTGIDKVLAHYSLQSKVPFVAKFVFLYAFNLKSSFFSLLPSKKSEGRKLKQENWEYNKRTIPSWTPPGFAFVIGWPLLTFGLRAFTGAMVVSSMGGQFASPAIMSLMLHFGIANLWNTVNNVERRLGVSVILLYGMWLTKAFAALQFYKVNPSAGKLLAVSLTWISAAVALETRTWQINPDPDTGKLEPLVPMQHPKWTTKFRWEQ